MGFLDSLRRALGGDAPARDRVRRLRLAEAWGLDPGADAIDAGPADPSKMAAPPDSTNYDRELWRRKLRTLLAEKLPIPEQEWADFLADAQALGFDRDWIESSQREEFEMLIRKVVSDGVVTLDEHHKLDLARRLIGIPEPEAEEMLHRVVGEAESFFGKPVEGA